MASNTLKPVFKQSVVSKPFNAFDGTTIPFEWNGETPIKNTYKIMDSNTREVLYQSPGETTSEKRCYIPDGGLDGAISNGHNYLFTACVSYRQNGRTVTSAWSDEAKIYCYSAPSISLTNLPPKEGDNPIRITVQTITIGIDYTCGQGDDTDELNHFKYIIYDANKNELASSNTFTDKTELYTIYGLDDGKIYFLRAVGTSVHGQNVDTGYVDIVIHLNSSSTSTNINVENNKCEGNILVSSNINVQDFYRERANIVTGTGFWSRYYLEARPNGYVCYYKGFKINGDISGKTTFAEPTPCDRVFYYKDEDNSEITARYMLIKGLDNTTVIGAYFLLEVKQVKSTTVDVYVTDVMNNYATDTFTPLTANDIVDLAISRELVSYVDNGVAKYYNSYKIGCKITTYNNNGEVVNEAWY